MKFRALKTCIKYKEFCNQDISNTITARSFKLCQLIKDDEWITWWNLVFFRYCPLQISLWKTCIEGILKTIMAITFKLSYLIENLFFFCLFFFFFTFLSYCPLEI